MGEMMLLLDEGAKSLETTSLGPAEAFRAIASPTANRACFYEEINDQMSVERNGWEREGGSDSPQERCRFPL